MTTSSTINPNKQIDMQGQQRINWYDNQNGRWYFAEQYNKGHWVTVGSTFDSQEYAVASVSAHNLRLELQQLTTA